MRSAIFRCLLLIMIAACSACTLQPTPRPDPRRFAGEIAAFARKEPEKGGIVFVGSSSIRLWSPLKKDFPGLPVVNRGFGGCVANDMVVYFETVVARHEPKLIVTYAGGNDIDDKLTVAEAFADYTKFLSMTNDRFPQARVIVNSVKIAPSRAAQVPKVNDLNRCLEAWCAGKEWVRFLESSSYLADASDQPIPAFFREDMLHLNSDGYAKWKAILEPVVREEWAKVK